LFAANPVLKDNLSHSEDDLDTIISSSFTNTADPANYNILIVMTGRPAGQDTVSVTYGSTSLTLAREQDCGAIDQEYADIWYATNVPLGTATITVTASASQAKKGFSALTYEGVSQISAITATSGFCESTNNFFTHSATITTVNTNSRVVGFETRRRGGTPPQFTALSGVTKLHDFTTSNSATGNAQRSFASGHTLNTTTGTKTFGFTSTQDQRYSMALAEVRGYQLTQASYRFFANNNSTDVGAPLAAENTPATLTSTGQQFRLRQLLGVHLTNYAGLSEFYRLQYAEKSGTCDASFAGETYQDVSASIGAIRFYNNATPSSGTTLTSNANDPNDGRTIINQQYQEDTNFMNATINVGQDGMWDFSLVDFSAPGGTTYCFRLVKVSSVPLLDDYLQLPEITTYAPPVVQGRSFRYYLNQDSHLRGGPIALKNVPISLPGQNSPVRLRQLLYVDPSGAPIGLSGENFKLQVSPKVGTCDTSFVGETYADLSPSSGAIRYYDNPTPADGTNITWVVGDPKDGSGGDPDPLPQTYEESNNFTNGQSLIPTGYEALWDFPIQDFSAPSDTSYCIRVVKSDGSLLNSYTQVAELKSGPSVTLTRNNATIAEAAGVSTFTATLSQTSDFDVTVNLGFTGTAAGSGTDYNASANSITIPAGSTTGTITVTAVQDLLDENDETVIVDITSVTNGTESGTQQATTTITDDDATPTVTLTTPRLLKRQEFPLSLQP
jgi:Calx-beta domain